MKKKNRSLGPIILSLFLCFISQTIQADGRQFTYDAAGNRTGMQVIVLRGTDNGDEREKNPIRENLNLHAITISPNPTEGRFSVEITDAESIEKASITIYTIRGTVIYSNEKPAAINEIDLTRNPDGLYLLVIKIGEESSTWKIIKI